MKISHITTNQLFFALYLIALIQIPKESSAQIVRVKWLNFSPYTEAGQNPNLNHIIPDSQIICLLDTLRPWTEGIRTFGTQYGLENIPRLAKERGFKVIVGIWLGNEDTAAGILANEQQIANGIAIANAGFADKLIVGSEVLLRDDLTPEQLIDYINQVQAACPDIPVSCADVCSKLIANPEVVNACDFVSPNIYPFWEGSPIACALQSFNHCYQDLVTVANGKEIFISESGWKSTGTPVGAAIPSLENAVRYDRALLHWSKAFNIEVNLFEAFDEPWKLPNDDGWGIFYNSKIMKPGMDTLFTPIHQIDTSWLCYMLTNADLDTLSIDYIPAIGSYLNLTGHVDYIIPCDYQIATYIKVEGLWWSKPTFGMPTVPIFCDGTWNVDITTGGTDNQATEICVFLIPNSYTPPLSGGLLNIPQAIYQNALDWICIERYILTSATLTATDSIICKGDSTILIADGGTTFLWETGETTDSLLISTEYTRVYTVTISDGMGGGAILSITVAVATPQLFSIETSTELLCRGDSVTLTLHTSSDVTEYMWNSGETTSSIVVSPDTTTTYFVTITNANGCSVNGEKRVDVYGAVAWASRDSICFGASTNIYAVSNNIGNTLNYLWSTGDTTTTVHVSPGVTTTYAVTVTSLDNCIVESQVTIFVSPLPVVTAHAYPASICKGDTALLVATGGPPYNWFTTGQTIDSIYVSPSGSTTYFVSVTDSLGCSNMASAFISVINNFSLSISISEDTIQEGESSILTANGGSATSYLWSTGETTSFIEVSPVISTTYSVTATDSDGCSESKSFTIIVIPIVLIKNINKITSIKVYPKPSNGIFDVELSVTNTKFVTMSLISEVGYILEHRIVRPLSGEIRSHFDLTFLQPGLYFIKLQTENGEKLIEKIPIF